MDWQHIYFVAGSLWPLWLMILFLGIVAWAYWPSHRQRFESYATIPLRDEDRDGEG